MITLGLKRLPHTDEWKITVKEDGMYLEAYTYYSSNKWDAVGSSYSMESILRDKGEEVRITKALQEARYWEEGL